MIVETENRENEMENLFKKVVEKIKQNITIEAKRLAEKYNYYPYMISRYINILGYDETIRLLEANEKPLPETIRCNDYLIDCQDLKKRLENKGYFLKKMTYPPHGFIITRKGIGSIGGTHEYLQGYYYIQDPASMSIVYALNPQPGDLILDMAAAPGGKATQILQLSRDKSYLIAVEKNPKRIRILRSHLQRMRFTRYLILLGDSRRVPLPFSFDKVLLDAPSTGEGIIRKDPSRKKSRTLKDLEYIHELQYELLSRAISLTKKGGIIVYSACTLAPEEGELVIDRILREYRNKIAILNHDLPASQGITSYFGIELDPDVRKCGRFWPHIHDTEGFFVCKLKVL